MVLTLFKEFFSVFFLMSDKMYVLGYTKRNALSSVRK